MTMKQTFFNFFNSIREHAAISGLDWLTFTDTQYVTFLLFPVHRVHLLSKHLPPSRIVTQIHTAISCLS